MMKAETKAKRRATLDLLGLGILDETETESIPGSVQKVDVPAVVVAEPTVTSMGDKMNPFKRKYETAAEVGKALSDTREIKEVASLYYVNAGDKEQILKLTHSQNITKNWNVGANFNRIGANGAYTHQRGDDLNAAVFTWYQSPNKR
ncbi:MAG: hypothetical protein EOP45_20185, partial [Sphingobacteriaceae bacterium]